MVRADRPRGRAIRRSAVHALDPGTLDLRLLAGEIGLHRRSLAEGEMELARVSVVPSVEDDASVNDEQDDGEVVRVYSEGRRRFVRDPRTGARVGDVAAVLTGGRIDDFLLAALRLIRA